MVHENCSAADRELPIMPLIAVLSAHVQLGHPAADEKANRGSWR
jgi:hypothetical protein